MQAEAPTNSTHRMIFSRLTVLRKSRQQIEQAVAMIPLADCLTRENEAATTIDRLLRILDRDSVRDAIVEVLVDSRVNPRPSADVPE